LFPEHTLGKFRLSVGAIPRPATQPTTQMRQTFLAQQQAEWEKSVLAKCAHWTVLDPEKFRRSHDGSIQKLDDRSLLFTGDDYYKDQCAIEFSAEDLAAMKPITGVRLEVLPDPSLPQGGPGRSPGGGFYLSEFSV